jgi:hypothetical protein
LMINGTTGVYADRDGVVEHILLATPYTNDRLQAAIERVARILGQDLTTQNPILNTRLPDGSRAAVVGAPSSINGPTLTIRKVQPLVHLRRVNCFGQSRFIAAKFEHDTARPVAGYAAPQLHTHAVIFNVTQREDGRSRALQERALFQSQQFARRSINRN